MVVLLTSTTGSIDRALTASLIEQKLEIVAAVLFYPISFPKSVQQVVVGNILPNTDLYCSMLK